MRVKLNVLAIYVACVLPCVSQSALASVGVWKTYTSKKQIRSLAFGSNTLWAATRGGVFSYSIADQRFEELTTSEGLRSIDITAVAVDKYGTVWIGAADGMLHAYTPQRSTWRYFPDIKLQTVPQKRINAFFASGDTLLIASDFGLSEFLIDRLEFRATARTFGGPGPTTLSPTSVVVARDTLWAGTATGVASANRHHPNLSAPDAWRVWTTIDGLPSNTITSLAVFGSRLFAGTAQGLAEFTGPGWSVVAGTEGLSIVHLASSPSLLYFMTTQAVHSLDEAGTIALIGSGFPSSISAAAAGNGYVALGTAQNAVFLRHNGEFHHLEPEGPATNSMVALAVDADGVVWVATGPNSTHGFMRFDGKTWKQYSTATYPQLGGNAFYNVSVGAGNQKWVSSWGHGVASVRNDGSVGRVFHGTNGLPWTLPHEPYVVVTGAVTDREGKTFVCIRTGRGDTTLVVVRNDSIVSYVVAPLEIQFRVGELAIDGNGTIWIAPAYLSPGASFGLLFYNERGLPGASGTRWARITQSDGLLSDGSRTIAVDHSGDVWVGSERGISILFRPFGVRPQIAAYYPLRDQNVSVNSIAVDALNRKWVATSQGVFLFTPDGTSILQHYTVENTDGKLIDNVVTSVAIDGGTGTVYFGSDRGMSSLTTPAVTPLRALDELGISPNPFYLPATDPMVVDGLMQNTNLKVLSIDGKLIRELRTPGGRIGFWDGLDAEGNHVGTGIYIIVAFAENGNQVAAGKVAVIRR